MYSINGTQTNENLQLNLKDVHNLLFVRLCKNRTINTMSRSSWIGRPKVPRLCGPTDTFGPIRLIKVSEAKP